MGEHHPAQHLLFGQFLDLGLDHHHRIVGASDHQVHPVVFAELVDGRVEHIFAIDEGDARRADRTHERQA